MKRLHRLSLLPLLAFVTLLTGCHGLARQSGPGLPFSARGEPVAGVQARLSGGGDPLAMTLTYDVRNVGTAPARVPAGLGYPGQGALIVTAIAGPRSRTRVVTLPVTAGGDSPVTRPATLDLSPTPADVYMADQAAGFVPLGSTTINAGRVVGLNLERGDLVSVVFVYENRPPANSGEWEGRAVSGPVVMRVE